MPLIDTVVWLQLFAASFLLYTCFLLHLTSAVFVCVWVSLCVFVVLLCIRDTAQATITMIRCISSPHSQCKGTSTAASVKVTITFAWSFLSCIIVAASGALVACFTLFWSLVSYTCAYSNIQSNAMNTSNEPYFLEAMLNQTVAVGRDAVFQCILSNLKGHQVTLTTCLLLPLPVCLSLSSSSFPVTLVLNVTNGF